jgi:hypothetical protein
MPGLAAIFISFATELARKNNPSRSIVAERDRMVRPELQLAMAKKINARVTS